MIGWRHRSRARQHFGSYGHRLRPDRRISPDQGGHPYRSRSRNGGSEAAADCLCPRNFCVFRVRSQHFVQDLAHCLRLLFRGFLASRLFGNKCGAERLRLWSHCEPSRSRLLALRFTLRPIPPILSRDVPQPSPERSWVRYRAPSQRSSTRPASIPRSLLISGSGQDQFWYTSTKSLDRNELL